MEDVRTLTTEVLDREMVRFVASDREMQWRFMIRLVEFDRRRAWSDYGSLWLYLTKRLKLAEGTAYRRMLAVDIIRKYPETVAYLADGRLWLSNVVLLRDALTPENFLSVLDRAVGKSKNEVLRLAKSFKEPIPEPPPFVRRVASAPQLEAATEHAADAAAAATSTESPIVPSQDSTSPSLVLVPPSPMVRKGEAKPVAANQHLIRMFVDDAFMELLDRAKHLVSHSVTNGDIKEVLRRGLAEIVAKHERRLSPTRPRKVNPWDPEQREIPAALWREVMERDGEKCVWKYEGGGICGSTWQIQVDHIVALALGGLTIASNLRCLCRKHNLVHARRTFGDELIDKILKRKRA